MWLTIIEWAGPGVNSRPGLYFLEDAINPWPLNGTDFYLEEASIPGNMVYMQSVILDYRIGSINSWSKNIPIHELKQFISDTFNSVNY